MSLVIAGKTFHNRLVLGTGKYKDFATSGLTASVTPKGSTQIRLDLE